MNTYEDEDCTPICEKCGAPITTSAMAMICPRKEQCELYPSDEESRKFIREFCERGTQET